MMNKTKWGVFLGTVAGIVDVILMLIQGITWDANLSAFSFWVITGFFIAKTDVPLKGALKGVLISLLLLVPLAFIIGGQNPFNLIPIVVMNIVLGSILGFLIEKHGKK